MTVDAVVIGGGPAGASAAIRLRRGGLRVRLYEKASFPRRKLCGGFLSPEAMAELSELEVFEALLSRGLVPIRRSLVVSPTGTQIESRWPQPAWSVSRALLDPLLIDKARQEGVEVVFGADGFLAPELRRFTVVATGRKTTVEPSPWYADPTERYYGIQALFEGLPEVTDQVEIAFVTGGYVGFARQSPPLVNVCALITQDTLQRFGPHLDHVIDQLKIQNDRLASHLSKGKRQSQWLSVGPVRLGIRQLVSQDSFYVGDAACVMDPFAGEGMAMGLYSAHLLAGSLLQDKEEPAQRYTRLWRAAFVPALRWNALARTTFRSFLREPIMWGMKACPAGLDRLTRLTRYRPVTSEAYAKS